MLAATLWFAVGGDDDVFSFVSPPVRPSARPSVLQLFPLLSEHMTRNKTWLLTFYFLHQPFFGGFVRKRSYFLRARASRKTSTASTGGRFGATRRRLRVYSGKPSIGTWLCATASGLSRARTTPAAVTSAGDRHEAPRDQARATITTATVNNLHVHLHH